MKSIVEFNCRQKWVGVGVGAGFNLRLLSVDVREEWVGVGVGWEAF